MNTVHIGVFTYQSNKYDWITGTANLKSRCNYDQENLIDKDSLSSFNEKNSLDCTDKVDKLIFEGHTLPCKHSDGFRKLTLKYLYTIVWFPEEICLLFLISDFFGQMSNFNNR